MGGRCSTHPAIWTGSGVVTSMGDAGVHCGWVGVDMCAVFRSGEDGMYE